MALVLVTTPAAANANSYATAAEGDTYHEGRLHSSDWTDATTAIKEAALVMATRLLDAQYEWVSWPTYPETQALQWPRIGITRRNRLAFIGNDEIPPELKQAVAEYARQLIVEDRSLDSDVETQGLSSLSVGSISMSFKESVYAKPVPDAVVLLIPAHWGTLVTRAVETREIARA